MLTVECANKIRQNDTEQNEAVQPNEDFKTGALNHSATLPYPENTQEIPLSQNPAKSS
jgi:hypothetical protein